MAAANDVHVGLTTNDTSILHRRKEIGDLIWSYTCDNRTIVCITVFATTISTAKDMAVDGGSTRRSDGSI